MIQMLDWLPSVENLPDRIRRARLMEATPAERLAAIRELTGFNRDMTATGRIDRLYQDCLAQWPAGEPLPGGMSPLRLTLLSSHTVDHLASAIRVGSLGRGVMADVQIGAYGGFRQALLGDDPAIRSFAPNVILLALDVKALLPAVPIGSAEAAEREVASAVTQLRQLWRQARERYGAEVVQQTFLPMTPPILGSFDALVPASPTAMCQALNQAVRAAARSDGVAVLEVEALPASCADADRHDVVRWHQAKQLINPSFAPLYGDHVARILAAIAGRSRKCLVLDLDNTLWGGVVGDDGIAGIRLGQGSAEGEAYLAFQDYVGRLRQAGIVLAVCSKNDEAIARQAFEQHGEMALKVADIACFIANWTDKAANIRSIAATLNLGLDSLVFVDDNPAERAIVRRELPQVAVPELPDDVAYYPARLAAAGYFEAVSLTADDLARAASYAANAERQALSSTTDLDGYLQSLEMSMVARPIGPADIARAVQLINKTNQFNLTTRRRTATELEALLAHPGTLAFGFRLRDRFGDNGLISVVIARPDPLVGPDELLVDTWLMSCRVLGRGVEKAALDILVAAAREQGARALVGEYRPTERNGLVAGLFDDLGFSRRPSPVGIEAEVGFWCLPIEAADAGNHHIALEAA